MAWGNASKSKAKSKPASKTKAKKVKKKYSLNDRYSYHFNKYHDNDYSKGYVTGIEIGKPDNLENKSVSFQQGNKNARMAKIKIQDIKF